MLVVTNSNKVALILEQALAEFRKQQTLKRRGTSVQAFADFLGFSRPIVTLWMSPDNDRDPSEDALLDIAPKLAELLGGKVYKELGIDRSDLLHHYTNRNWKYAPLKVQKQIAEIIAEYSPDPIPNENSSQATQPKTMG